ncbi:MAG TPA: hypothetical protein VHH73_13575 [Verrucomicrobiae bacterium]|nr:hypothetical protein [Verrucomicrobiae bacterium]
MIPEMEPKATPGGEEKSPFAMVIIYDSTRAFGRGKALQEGLARGSLSGVEMECGSWSLEWLKDAQQREKAVIRLAAADMVVVSLTGPFFSTSHAPQMLLGLAGRKTPMAMVALIGERAASYPESRALASSLNQIAVATGATFFCAGWENTECPSGHPPRVAENRPAAR